VRLEPEYLKALDAVVAKLGTEATRSSALKFVLDQWMSEKGPAEACGSKEPTRGMAGLIEFSPLMGLDEQTDRASVEGSIIGRQVLQRLTRHVPSKERLVDLHRLRVVAGTCPFAALALACLFNATIEQKPRRNRRTCWLFGQAVRHSASRLNALKGQTSPRYEMALRQAAVEALRLLAANALEQFDMVSAAEYLKAAESFAGDIQSYESAMTGMPARRYRSPWARPASC
jgi:hypothetical protein